MIARQGAWLAAKAGETIVMRSTDGGDYVNLGEVGARIWELLETPQELDALCAQLQREFDVPAEICRTEVQSFLGDLATRGAISLDAQAAPEAAHPARDAAPATAAPPADASAGPGDLARQGYVVLRGVLEPALTDFLWSYVHTKFASLQMSGGDPYVPNTPSSYCDPALDGLMEYLRPRIEAATGKRLYPTFSYCRFHKHGDRLPRHSDRPACEFVLSMNVGQVPPTPWPLQVEGAAGPFSTALGPGDGLLYRGIERAHWRDRFEGERLVQVILNYVDADGPHADQKFDGRRSLMVSKPGQGAGDALPG